MKLLADAFGNALGNSIVEGMQPPGVTSDQWSEAYEQLGADVNASQGQFNDQLQYDLRQQQFQVSLQQDIERSLSNNPEFSANLPIPTAEFEEDIFGSANPFAGERLVNSYDDAVRSFDQRLLSGIDAAARAPQAGPYIQFDPAYVDQQIAARAARNTPATKLGMTEGEYGEFVSQRQTDVASREYFLRHPDASNPFGAVGGWQAGFETLGEGVAYIGAQALDAAYQPIGQALDLGELAVAGMYNLFSDDTYELTGFSRLSSVVANGGLASEIWREGLGSSTLGSVGLGAYDLTSGLGYGDTGQVLTGGVTLAGAFLFGRPAGRTAWQISQAERTAVLRAQGFQEHHIISDKNPLTQNHELLQLADFDLQSRTNKIFLPSEGSLHPTRSIHAGRHTGSVNADLASSMDQVVRAGRQQNWSQLEYNQALRTLISDERQLLRSGDRALNRNARPWGN